MLSRIYIKYIDRLSGEIQIYELSVTEDENYTMASQATQSKVQENGNYADHQVRDNKIIRLSGLISSVTSIYTQGEPEAEFKDNKVKGTEDFIDGLEAIRDAGGLVTAIFGRSGRVKRNCLLKDLSFSRDSKNTTSYKVSIMLEQIQVTSSARKTTDYSTITVNDKFSGKVVKLDGAASVVYMQNEMEKNKKQAVAINYMQERDSQNIYYDKNSFQERFRVYYEETPTSQITQNN